MGISRNDRTPEEHVRFIRVHRVLDAGRVARRNAIRIRGELTLHGATHTVILSAIFNGSYAGHPMDPHARGGVLAHGTFKRSEFGIAFGVPVPAHTSAGDEVEVSIETELSGPEYQSGRRAADRGLRHSRVASQSTAILSAPYTHEIHNRRPVPVRIRAAPDYPECCRRASDQSRFGLRRTRSSHIGRAPAGRDFGHSGGMRSP